MATITLEQHLKEKTYVDQPEILPWYIRNLEDLQPKAKELFEAYSKVPSDEVVSHITEIRDKAFKISFAYEEVLQRLKDGEQYLDIGCCMGQDIRKLVHDGAPSDKIYASDLQGEFWDVGYEMFLDKSSLKATFIQADIFDDKSGLQQVTGKFDIIHAASFFHLFDWDGQVIAAKRIVSLLNPESNGLILGRQAAREEAGAFTAGVQSTKSRFWHNLESWAKLWEQVGQETGTEWHVEAVLDDRPDHAKKRAGMADFIPQDSKFMRFIIRKA